MNFLDKFLIFSQFSTNKNKGRVVRFLWLLFVRYLSVVFMKNYRKRRAGKINKSLVSVGTQGIVIYNRKS